MIWPFNGRRKNLVFLILAPMAVLVLYQNCGKGVNFEKIEADLNSNGLGGPAGPCAFGCREGKLDPKLNTERPPVKVVFIVDNSKSMTAAQQYLSDGVRGLLERLRGFDASFFVQTTTQSGVKQIVGSEVKSCSWEEGMTPVSGTECPNSLATTYSLEQLFPMAASLTQASSISREMSDSEFRQVETTLAEDIAHVGVNGSGDERGICSLTRTVFDKGPNKFFNQGDTAAFVLISDEEDVSSPASCLSREVTATTFGPKPNTTGACVAGQPCDSYGYTVKFASIPKNTSLLNFKCPNPNPGTVVCDVSSGSCTANSYSVKLAGTTTYSAEKKFRCFDVERKDDGVFVEWVAGNWRTDPLSASECNSTTGTTNLDKSLCASLCGARAVSDCQRVCTSSTPTVTETKSITNPSQLSVDFCTSSYTEGANTYSNIKRYFESLHPGKTAQNCVRTGSKPDPTPLNKSLTWDSTEPCPTDVQAVIASKQTQMQTECGTGQSPSSPILTCGSNPTPVNDCTFRDTANTTVDLCSHEFSKNAISYADAKAYCSQISALNPKPTATSCSRDGGSRSIPQTGVVQTAQTRKKYSFPLDKRPEDITNLQNSFLAGASELFGEKGYFVSAIIRDLEADLNVPGCNALEAYESYGTKYRSLVAATPNGGSVSSICATNYGESLARVQRFVKESTERSYRVADLGLNERIIAVWLEKATGLVELKIGVDVQVVGPRIEFESAQVLEAGTKIGYKIEKTAP